MRRFVVKKRFSDFLSLQSLLIQEMNIFPNVLQKDLLHKVFLGDISTRGVTLATFLNDVHYIFASRGLFSPRLMNFLNIDILKVFVYLFIYVYIICFTTHPFFLDMIVKFKCVCGCI
jgi:hypothetical protein